MPPAFAAVDELCRRARSIATQGLPVRVQRPERGPRHMSIMVVDMAGFGRLGNRAQMRVRATLYAIVRDALRRAGIRWRLAIEDRGDGMIVLVPASKSTVDLLDPVVPMLAAHVHEHNETAWVRIRLRLSVHAGVVHRDPTGWVGSDLTTACRLVDSPAVRHHFDQHPADDLVVIASDSVYHGVVQHGYRGIDPATYEPLQVEVKELRTRAWVHLPPRAPTPDGGEVDSDPPTSPLPT